MRSLLMAVVGAVACGTADTTPPVLADVTEVFGRSCAFSTCHGAGAGGLTLRGEPADRDRLIDVLAEGAPTRTLVVPGDAAASYLMAKLDGSADIVGDSMPQAGDLLDAATRDVVRAWIEAGATAD